MGRRRVEASKSSSLEATHKSTDQQAVITSHFKLRICDSGPFAIVCAWKQWELSYSLLCCDLAFGFRTQ